MKVWMAAIYLEDDLPTMRTRICDCKSVEFDCGATLTGRILLCRLRKYFAVNAITKPYKRPQFIDSLWNES